MIAKRRELSDKTQTMRESRNRIVPWVAAGGIVVIAIISMYSFRRGAETPRIESPNEKTAEMIAEVEPLLVSSVVAEPSTEEQVAADPRKRPHPAYKQPTNPNLPQKKYIPTVEEVENARLGPDGRPRRTSIYKSAAEQALGMIFSTELGSPPPMLPDIPKCTSREQLEDFLNTTFAYDKEASRAVNENRLMMEQVREELNRYLGEGGDIGGFIEYYVGELRASHEQWKTAQTMIIDMARSGEDAESLRSFRDAANRLLAEKGIRELKVPPSVRRAMGEE